MTQPLHRFEQSGRRLRVQVVRIPVVARHRLFEGMALRVLYLLMSRF
jgi:hypothetical protein